MRRKGVEWLYGELPELVRGGVLSTDAAEHLRRHYGEGETRRWNQVAFIVCGTLGALLVGVGIIFLLAYNWSALSRPARVVVALVPLVATQVLGGWVIWCRPTSVAWREGVATFLMLSLAAGIALVQQTYHVPFELDAFLLPWTLLSLPLVYLLGATVPAILYLVGIAFWAGYADLAGGQVLVLWLLAALVGLHFWQAARKHRYAVRPALLGWVMALWAGPAILLSLRTGAVYHVFASLAGLYAVLYLAGAVWFGEASSAWRRPFHSVGAAGVVVVSFILSFRSTWEEIMWRRWHEGTMFGEGFVPHGIVVAVFAVGTLGLLAAGLRRRRYGLLLFGVAPGLVFVGWHLGCVAEGAAWLPALLFNAYVVALGVGTLVPGLLNKRLGQTNLGVLLIAALVAVRFIDSDMGLLVKGIGCLVVGTGFLVANLVVQRLRKGAAR